MAKKTNHSKEKITKEKFDEFYSEVNSIIENLKENGVQSEQ